MRLFATIKPEDVETNVLSFDYETFTPRTAARAIVLDGKEVALIHVSEHNYYMLPGGGIDNDNLQAGLAREILEELGCEIETTGEVGSIEVYNDRWRKKQKDYCYTVRKVSSSKIVAPTGFEIEEGHKIVWASGLEEAVKLVRDAAPKNRDGKLIRARDLVFLEQVARDR